MENGNTHTPGSRNVFKPFYTNNNKNLNFLKDIQYLDLRLGRGWSRCHRENADATHWWRMMSTW